MLRKFFFALIFASILFSPLPVFAADTCCLNHGGDYACNYQTSQLYCQDGTVSNQCTCQAAPTPTPTAVPTQIPVVSQGPQCPTNASIDTSNTVCTCNTGYVVNSNACVTYAQYCQGQYGTNAYYNSTSNACACASGYTWNADASKCVTMDDVCNQKLGGKSYYNSTDNSCYCYAGFAIQNNQCQLIPTPVPPGTLAPTKGIPIAIPTSVPIPTIAHIIVPTRAPTKAPVKKVLGSFNYNKKVPGLNGFVAVKKKHNGFLADLLSSLWDALRKAFNI